MSTFLPLEVEAPFQALIDGLAAHVAVLDDSGVVRMVNAAWRSFAQRNGGSKSLCEGADYLGVCRGVAGASAPDGQSFAAGLEEVLAGRRAEFSHEYPCMSADDFRWFVARVRQVGLGGRAVVVVAHENITDRKRVETELTSTGRRLAEGRPLREAEPELFTGFVTSYQEVLDLALEQKAYRVSYNLSDRLRELAGRLATINAGPRDVIEVHSSALESRARGPHGLRVSRAVEEGRLLLLELMGHLAASYRSRSLLAGPQDPHAGGDCG